MIYGPLIVDYFNPKGTFRLILNGAIYTSYDRIFLNDH